MNKIYVEPSDEITTVIERLKGASDELVAVIVPKGATLLQSIVNLKLARKAALDSGKTFVLVTTDKIGRNLASQLEIPVASTEKEIEQALHAPPAQDDTQVISGVRIHRYYDDPEEVKEALDDAHPKGKVAPAIEPIIIPKKLVTQAEETPVVTSSKTTPETPPVSSQPQAETEKTVSEGSAAAAVAATAASEAVTSNQMEKMERRSIDRAPLTPPADTSIARSQITPRQAIASSTTQRDRRRLSLLFYILGVLVVVLAVISFLFLPVTDAQIQVQADNWSKDLTFTASTAVKTPSANNTQLPATLTTVDATDSVTFKATGTKNVGTAATGTVDLYNSTSSDPLTLPAGSTITASNQNFTTNTDVTVPGLKVSGGKVIPGHNSVAVTAVTPGTSSNLSNATISSVPLSNNNSLSGTLNSSGGTDQTVPVVTDADIAAAKTALTQKLTTDLQQKISDAVNGKNLKFDSTADTLTFDAPTQNVNSGDQQSSGQLQGTGHLARLVVSTDDITTAARTLTEAQTPANTTRQVIGTTVTQFTVSPDHTSANIVTTTTGKQSAILNTTTIKQNLKGKTPSAAQAYIQSTIPHANLELSEKPGWWPVSRLPYFDRFVKVSITYE